MELHYPSQTRFGSLTGQLFFYELLVVTKSSMRLFKGNYTLPFSNHHPVWTVDRFGCKSTTAVD